MRRDRILLSPEMPRRLVEGGVHETEGVRRIYDSSTVSEHLYGGPAHPRSMFPSKFWKSGLTTSVAVCCVGLMLANGNSRGRKSMPANENALLAGSSVPLPARAILQRACVDCHSDNTVWPWYAHIPLVSWEIHSDVARGRAFMNLSRWSAYSDGERRGLILAILTDTKRRVMPPPEFVLMHGNAKLSDTDLKELEGWAVAATRVRPENGKGSSRQSGFHP
jgi:hypothetical protein